MGMGWKVRAAFEVVFLPPSKFKEHDFNTRLEPHTHFLPKHNSMDWHKGPEAEPRVFLSEFADYVIGHFFTYVLHYYILNYKKYLTLNNLEE
jgi:hypothetical protein